MEPYRIRPARPADLPLLPAIERAASELFRQTAYAHLVGSDDATRSFPHQPNYLTWVAVDATDAPIGLAIARPLANSLHLQELDVHPNHSRRGLGRRLITAVADYAQSHGYTALTLTTFRSIPWNAPYYNRLGFRTLEPDELPPDLQAIYQSEIEHGLPMGDRVCMRRELLEDI